MKKILMLVALATTVFSCSKEKSIDNTDPSGGTNNTSNLLVKTSIKVGNDSAVNNYGYDNQKRLISQAFTGNFNLLEDYGQTSITRNAQGVIERIMTVDEGSGDQTEYKVYYDATGKKYTAKTTSAVYQGVTLKDSVAYTYNANGQITQEVYFINEGTGYYDYGKTEYTYSAANLTSAKYYYKNTSNAYQQSAAITYEYDTKGAAMTLGAEGIVLQQTTYVSANNLTKLIYTDLEDPTQNETVSFTYIYNSAGRPTNAVITIKSVGNVPIPMSYFYN
jgi:hypothetical protein